MNTIISAEIEHLDFLTETDGLSKRLIEELLLNFLSYLSKICLAQGW